MPSHPKCQSTLLKHPKGKANLKSSPFLTQSWDKCHTFRLLSHLTLKRCSFQPLKFDMERSISKPFGNIRLVFKNGRFFHGFCIHTPLGHLTAKMMLHLGVFTLRKKTQADHQLVYVKTCLHLSYLYIYIYKCILKLETMYIYNYINIQYGKNNLLELTQPPTT